MINVLNLGLLVSVFIVTFVSGPLYGDDLGKFGERVFMFQENLAKSGNKIAQYKLGSLYEFGVAVQPDLNAAVDWYRKSANQGYEPAADRIVYLEIQSNGYDAGKHQEWFTGIQNKAKLNDGDALILLGQIYRDGIIVEKDLEKTLEYYEQASSLGQTEIDAQIYDIRGKLEAREEKLAEQKEKEQARRKVQQRQQELAQRRQQEQARQRALEEQRKRQEAAEKKRRYQEAMRKLQEENRLLQQTQQWSESN